MEQEKLLKELNLELFSEGQIVQIFEGLKKDLDVSIYAKKEYNSSQMLQIRIGLEKNLNISQYAKFEYNERQMAEIREGL